MFSGHFHHFAYLIDHDTHLLQICAFNINHSAQSQKLVFFYFVKYSGYQEMFWTKSCRSYWDL